MTEFDIKDVITLLIGFVIGIALQTVLDFDIVVRLTVMFSVVGGIVAIFAYRYYHGDEIRMIIKLLENYEKINTDEQKEMKTTEKLGNLFPKLRKAGFRNVSEDTIKNTDFEIHLTRSKPQEPIHQFLIRKSEFRNGFRVINAPTRQYLSIKYPAGTREELNSDVRVLNEFIEYLRTKM